MSSCTSIPTLTRTDQVVTDSLSTSTTTHVTTLPPSTTTITLTPSCTATVGTCIPRPVVTTSEIPGGTTTVVDTVTITVPVTSTQVTTLWSTSCTQTDQNTPSTPAPQDSTTSTSTTWTPTFSTPPPSLIVTASSSTQADGVVTPITYTITSTLAPVAVSSSASPGSNGSNTSDSSKNLGAIIGGVVGGVVGLGAIIFLVWFFLRRKKRWDDIFENDDDVPAIASAAIQKEKQAESKPKPYQYGLVGHTKSPSLTSPPSSPPPGAAPSLADTFNNSHHRNNSTTPLLGPPMSTTTHGTSTSPTPRPPSSTASVQGYGFQDANAQGLLWDPARLYNQPAQQQAQFTGASTGAPNAAAAAMGRRDFDPRAGSPVSFQEQRILQVANADLVPQSPSSPGPGLSASAGRTSLDPQRDGKGRIVTKGEKAPIVHLDGGRYQQRAGSSSAAVSAPPAYSE